MLISLVFGVLVDVDHLFDYFYAERRPHLELGQFLKTQYWRRSGRIFLLFHAFEYLPLLYLFWRARSGRRWALAATGAMSVHLLSDHLINDLKPLGYFIVYRIAHRFRAAEIIDPARARRSYARAERKRSLPRGRPHIAQRIASIFY